MAPFSLSRKSSKRSHKTLSSNDETDALKYNKRNSLRSLSPSPEISRTLTHELLSNSPTGRKSLEANDRTFLSAEQDRFKPFNHSSDSQLTPGLRVLTPEITSVKSRRSNSPNRSFTRPFRRSHDFDPEDFEVQRIRKYNSQEVSSPIDPASVPVFFERHLDSPQGDIHTSTPNKDIEFEEHLGNKKLTPTVINEANTSTGSGFLSSVISAAHNAASNIISSKPDSDINSPPKTNETEPLKTQGSTTTFVQHLDSLLFGSVKEHNSRGKPSAEVEEEYEHDDDGMDQVTLDSNATKSNVRGINFQPIRKTNISTIGTGELRLEDLGLPNQNSSMSRMTSPVSTTFNSSTKNMHIPSVSITSDDSLDVTSSRSSVSLGQVEMTNNISSPNRQISPSRPEILRPVSMPLQSLEILNGSQSFTEETKVNPSIQRPASPIPQTQNNSSFSGLRGRARSLGSSLIHPNFGSGGSSSSKTLSDHSEKRTSYLEEPEARDLGVVSRSSSMSRIVIPENSNGNFKLKNISYANSKRDSEFHNIFKKLPQDEKLIDVFACALQKDILVQGKLYLSSCHISFKSNILGWITNVIIPLKEIVRLEKRNTAGVFPNAISIQTLHAKYTFSSFLSRDSTFELITNVWNQLIRGGSDLGEEEFIRGVSNFDSDYSDDSGEDDEGIEDMISEDDSDDDDGLDNTDSENEKFNRSSDGQDDTKTPPSSVEGEIGPLKHSPTSIVREPQPNETKIIDKTIDAPLGKIYNVLFGDDTSGIKSIISRQGNKDISPIPSFTMDNSIRKRYYEYTKPLSGPVGPKQTLCQVSEVVEHHDFNNFVLVTQTTKNPDVPSGNSFVVVTQIYLSWAENNMTKLEIFSYITWNAKSWLKGPIESGTISGQKESLGILAEELIKILSGGRSKSSSSSEKDDEEEGKCTLPTMGPKTHAETDNEYKQKQGDVFITEETFDIPLGTLYSVLFGDDTSYIKQIITAQKNKEISEITKFDKSEASGKRTYNYIKPLGGAVGPKQTKCIITESLEFFNLEKSITVLQSTQTPDVPSGNSFTTNTTFYLSWAKDNSTKMYVVTFMNWTGKSWLKGPIERGAIDGQKESIKILVDEVKTIIANNTSGKKRKKGKRGKRGKEEEEEEKENAKRKSFRNELLKDRPYYQISSFGISSNISIILLVIFIMIALLFTHRAKSNHLSINNINHLNIDGQEFILMPLVSDLTSSKQLQDNAEFEIWEWINERSSTNLNGSSDQKIKDSDKKNDQHLREMIRVVEGQLQSLKQNLKPNDEDILN